MSHSDPDWLPQVLPSYDFEAEADAIERAEAKEDERMTEAILSGAPDSRLPAGRSGLQPGLGAPSLSRAQRLAYLRHYREVLADARAEATGGVR